MREISLTLQQCLAVDTDQVLTCAKRHLTGALYLSTTNNSCDLHSTSRLAVKLTFPAELYMMHE